jgi:hypothetical protein
MEYLLIGYARRISGPFPTLSLAGQFLLKDLGLMAAAVNVIAMAPDRESPRLAAQAVTA